MEAITQKNNAIALANSLSAENAKLADSLMKKLADLVKNLTPERKSISEAMIFCIENADKAEEISDYLNESILTLINDDEEKNVLSKSLSRLYLISDVLHNCSAKIANVANYRRRLELVLPKVFENLNKILSSIDSKMKSESFKHKVIVCIKAWQCWAVYPDTYLNSLRDTFLEVKTKVVSLVNVDVNDDSSNSSNTDSDDVDGVPLDEEEL